MKVLVLGGSGYVGSRIAASLAASGWAEPVAGSRVARGASTVQVDTTDLDSMRTALRGMDAVVNCVAGSERAIAGGARVLAQAAREAGCRRLVHLSTMSVYGALEGEVAEDAPRDPSIGWYAKAKIEAEDIVAGFARGGGSAVVLRPGCVAGAGSELWVGRIGRWLRAGRLGDLGAAGDGWSNLVAVDDVARAVVAALRDMPAIGDAPRVYNLAAPDSPRWNEWFVDLALAIGATPVRRLSGRRVRLDAKLLGPPLKVAEILATKARVGMNLPDAIPPGLPGVFERHLHLRSDAASRELGIAWTPYPVLLRESVAWLLRAGGAPGRRDGSAVRSPVDPVSFPR